MKSQRIKGVKIHRLINQAEPRSLLAQGETLEKPWKKNLQLCAFRFKIDRPLIMLEREVKKLYSTAAPHVHTDKSDGLMSSREIVKIAKERGISVIAITDHETMRGVEEAKLAGEELGVDIIPGQEITTNLLFPPIHIIGLNLKREIPPFQGLEFTIEEINRQGGLVILPHPTIGSLSGLEILRLVRQHQIVGIEVFCGNQEYYLGRHMSRRVALIGSSDSHFGKHDLLKSYTLFPGETKEDFLDAIVSRTTMPCKGEADFPGTKAFVKQQMKALLLSGLKKYFDHFFPNKMPKRQQERDFPG